MNVEQWVVLVHAFATVAMAGLIWFVQIVHYPLFALVGEREFGRYSAAYLRRTTHVVLPLMLTELVTAGWLAWQPPAPEVVWATLTGLVLLAVIWLSTALWQVPCHRRLERGHDVAIVKRLVASNWVRTAAWTSRSALALYLVGHTGLSH